MKKLLIILTVIAMMTSLVVACGPAETTPTTTTIADPDETTTAPDETDDPGMEGPSWTWDTSPVTIEWYVHEGWYDKQWDAENVVHDAYITEMTGVTLNITSGGEDERLNAMIAADNLPDVITIGWYLAPWPQLQSSGLLQPLLPLIKEHAPTFELPDSLVGWYTHDDGEFYGFPSFFWAHEHMSEDNFLETNDGIIAREDIMNQLDISREDFNTVEGALDAFRKVRDAELVYDGHRVIPVNLGAEAGTGTKGGTADTMRILANHFGIPSEDSEGNLIERRYDERFLDVLRFMNTLYKENLMSLDNFTMDRSTVEEQYSAGAIFCLVSQLSDYMGASRTLFDNDNAARSIAVGPIRQYEDQPVYLSSRATSGWTVTAISHNAQNTDRIIRFFEFSYGEEGQLTNAWGVEGVTWEWDDNGKVVWTDEYNQAVDEDAAQNYGHNNFWWFYNPPFHQLIESPPERPSHIMTHEYYNYFTKWTYNAMALSDIDPRGGTDEAALVAEIDIYWSEQLPRMIMASSEAEMETIWRNAVDTVYAMGYGAVYEVQNARLQMLKERLGQDFVWPDNQ